MKVALFDFDGTIVYSEHLWKETFDTFEKEYSLPQTPYETRMKQMTGSVLMLATEYYNSYEKLSQFFDSPQSLAMYFNKITEKKVHSLPPIEGVREFITELHERKIPIIIATSGRKEHIIEYLTKWNIIVDDIVTGNEVKHPKPAVDVYVEAMKRSGLSVQPSDCFIFEDNPQPAVNASQFGFHVCMIKYQNKSIFTQSFEFADLLITSFEHISEKIFK